MTGVLQIVPDDGVGGVELAARAAVARQGGKVRLFVLDGPPKDPLPVVDGIDYGNAAPGRLTSAFRALKAAQAQKPEVIVFSLWKTWLAFALISLFGPQAKRVVFLHCTQPTHMLDRLLTLAMMTVAEAIWADSEETLRRRLPRLLAGKPTRTITFLLHRPPGGPRIGPRPQFAFWGRVSRLKRMDRAVRLIAHIPEAGLLIVGPDGGQMDEVRRVAAELGVADRVTFTGPKTFDEIPALVRDSRFFILCSRHEGMSMSTVEAMQLGLVPVVTPAGEIARYCQHMVNAVMIETEEQAAADVVALLENPEDYARLSRAAIDRWASARLYDEDFMAAARALATAPGRVVLEPIL